ncbi:MAG TPA: PSD1 and planctomycete cytochrome C domain-containing protein [Fimbriimonadaceae bacterium]|jgi:mono/diheme cytochrome c family protein
MHAKLGTVLRSRLFWTSATFGVSLAVFAVAAAQKSTPAFEQNPSPSQSAFFEEKIRPILVNACSSCHGAISPAAGLRLDTADGLHKGGKSGAAVTPGLPDASLLIQAVRQTGALKMPQGGMLKPEEVAALEAWVRMGAPWPADGGAQDPTAGLWSLQPVTKPTLPRVHNTTWTKNAIDFFVLAGLESKHIQPAAPADKRTLLRRVTYDLTGLPPTPEEMDAFVADKTTNAYEKVVDRLLASPHYGERWARHWMDVARYADTKGYVFVEDRNYYNAYTYRNWLIDAFNKDLPYSQFVIDQLAADRLPEVQNGQNREDLAALGFLTVGRRFLNSRPDIIDDRIDVTMRGFQAFTVACARCHDHKFDPIPTQDYYSLYAVFNSSEDSDQPISAQSISGPWQQYNEKLTNLQRSFQSLSLAQTKLLRKQEEDPTKAAALTQEVKQILQSLGLDAVPDGANLQKLMPAFESAARDQLIQIQKQVEALQKSEPTKPEFAMAMLDSNPHDGVVFKHGNPNMPGDPAPRRFLLALSKPGEERSHWTKDSGRLELAESIASKDNPLTARVFVNRLWQDHFGNGIVRTASDFGRQGDKPTNPGLLDYLAATFMEDGWSIKKIQKLIVMSATYRQSSTFTPAAFLADPDNRLQSRFDRGRLDLEEMRDTVMDVAGQLDLSKVGGKSVDLWSEPFTQRRAVYGFIERQNLPGVFRTFDLATPDRSSPKRFKTTVPQQALFFMNSPFVVQQAELVAKRPEIAASKDEGQRVRRIYRLLFQRMPDASELAMGLAYLKQGANAEVPGPVDPWSYGYGGVDPATSKVANFTPLSYFDGAYRVGKVFPDPKLGYVTLNKEGGHPGHDGQHCAIRRWTASADMTIQISGAIVHRQAKGDGVKARIISSRTGLLGEWTAHNSQAATDVSNVQVQKGDTIDFVLDPMSNDTYDAFTWVPSIRSLDGKESWSAATNFGPPAGPDLNRITLYIQALMMTNEFMFVD